MTDKQIMIDGIDVSGCEWISEVGLDSEYICNCNSPNKTSGYCKYNPNCCYKQLKRKEQEYKTLEEIAKKHLAETFEMQKEIDQLKAENDTYKKMLKDEEVILALTEVRTGERHLWFNKTEEYKQTLIEIKEYCTDMKKDHYWGMRMMRFANEVLQKISEVLDEEV